MVKQDEEPSWEIRSQEAKSIHKGMKINFNKNVVIHQGKTKTAGETTLKTEALSYFPKRKLATTSQPVRFEQPGILVHSTGMNAYLNDKRIELLNKTQARYEPKKKA